MAGNELRDFRLRHQLPVRDMVEVVRTLYPKYDKTVQSKCENSSSYGTQLMPDAMALLYKTYEPMALEGRKKPPKEKHRLTCPYICPVGRRRLQGVATASGSRWILHHAGTAYRSGSAVPERKGGCKVNIPDHPVIFNMERTGTPDGKKPTYPHCPFCDKECETMYKDRHGAYIGCDVCVETKDAWEVNLCFPESEKN